MAETGREVVTLQLGNYSNFVGAHFWNIQERILRQNTERDEQATADGEGGQGLHAINHNVLFRSRERKGRVVYTPRAVVFDLAGAFGSMPTLGSLNPDLAFDFTQEASKQATWGGGVIYNAAPAMEKSSFLKSVTEEGKENDDHSPQVDNKPKYDGKKQYWTDFLNLHLEKSNIFQMPGIHLGVNPFDYFSHGSNLLRENARLQEGMEDLIRKQVENCDQLQGFQVMMDIHDAWAGVGCELMSHMADEYARSPVLVFGNSRETAPPPKARLSSWKARALINSALVLQSLTKLSASCTYVPLAVDIIGNRRFSGLSIDTKDVFSSSALLALSVHNATLPYRLSQNFTSMSGMIAGLRPRPSLHTVSLSVSLPIMRSSRVLRPGWGFNGVEDDREKDARGGGSHVEGEGRQKERLFAEPMTTPLSMFPGGNKTSSSSSSKSGNQLKPKNRRAREWLHSEWAVVSGVNLLNNPPTKKHLSSQPLGEYLQAAFANSAVKQQVSTEQDCWNSFERNFNSSISCSSRFCSRVNGPVSLPESFPDFFREPLGDTREVALLTDFYSCDSMHADLRSFQTRVSGCCAREKNVVSQFEKHGFGPDDWLDLQDSLRGLVNSYDFLAEEDLGEDEMFSDSDDGDGTDSN